MGRLVLVHPGPGAPDLLPVEVWQALSRPHLFVAPGDELGLRLADAAAPFALLEEAAPERLRRPTPTDAGGMPAQAGARREIPLLAGHRHASASPAARAVAERLAALAAERGEATFVLPRAHAEEITRAVLDLALSGEPEVEIVMGRGAPGARLLELVRVMARLRGPGGCPWDREQTHQTLVPYLLDETYELLEAIERGDPDHIAEELGDLLLQVVFHAQMGADAGTFDIDEVAARLVTKLVTRHPHVFGDVEVSGAAEVVANWEVIKEHEKGRSSVLEGVPEALPALAYAAKLQRRAARAGIDRDGERAAAASVRERLGEVEAASAEAAEERIGELLLAAVALARDRGVDAETALRRAARRFRDRVARLEEIARERGRDLNGLSADEIERMWREAGR